jgi:hypothetical protein
VPKQNPSENFELRPWIVALVLVLGAVIGNFTWAEDQDVSASPAASQGFQPEPAASRGPASVTDSSSANGQSSQNGVGAASIPPELKDGETEATDCAKCRETQAQSRLPKYLQKIPESALPAH